MLYEKFLIMVPEIFNQVKSNKEFVLIVKENFPHVSTIKINEIYSKMNEDSTLKTIIVKEDVHYTNDVITFLKSLTYISNAEIKDLILGYTDLDVLLDPKDLDFLKQLTK
jgi:predicted transcriptional regulator